MNEHLIHCIQVVSYPLGIVRCARGNAVRGVVETLHDCVDRGLLVGRKGDLTHPDLLSVGQVGGEAPEVGDGGVRLAHHEIQGVRRGFMELILSMEQNNASDSVCNARRRAFGDANPK
ncbi:hypothetical protein BHE74_00035444 [Ensete ventricosum]|uniref:Uncharacterized protein n=1 Tax=Ensete ventricosum TaxID=4639 RepID=A0A426YAU9_ENSVE|nr:hypothetical protein B296_00035979 [Ensete ventricosum]RWW08843.1 hypothetical protein GW17_00027692 [Ensete ventricosum]RWW57739.1 hypothetical protein BHE74_00035444 [Ensete ventricosum]RZR94760.1 hypothetical protein BHM03_00023514 [Ensete ventricosum]